MKYMVWLGTWLLLFAAAAHSNDCDSLRLIRVRGEAVVAATPDKAVVTLGLESKQEKLDNAKQRVDSLLRVINSLSREYGIPEKDVSTQRYVILPANAKRTKHVVKATVIVTVTDMVSLNPFISRAVDAGVDEVKNVTFELFDPSSVRIRARELAAAAARSKAEAILRGLGAKLGPVFSVRDVGWANSPSAMTGISSANLEEDARIAGVTATEDAAIAIGQIEERASVEVAFEIGQ